jgi:cytochrome c oxidase subunit 3
MSRRDIRNRHFYHLVDASPWPIVNSACALSLVASAIVWFNQKMGACLLFSIFSLIFCSILWFKDVVREGTFEGHHTVKVQTSLRFGMILFIVSEVMFFFSFFWTFFHSSLSPDIQIGCVWPPVELTCLKTFRVPALNTAILLTSGAAVTWAHYGLIKNDRDQVTLAFSFTLFLAVLFTAFQVMEYLSSKYYMTDGIYGSIFFMITGFHGFHVIIGSIFLAVCFFRFLSYHFTPKHHLGFQAAAWYWHFVDVVWILLFFCVYMWGNS